MSKKPKKLSSFSKEARINIANNICQDYMDNNPFGKTLEEISAEYFKDEGIENDAKFEVRVVRA
jgi:hypothetical protein